METMETTEITEIMEITEITEIMHDIVLAKFTQNPDLKAKLIATCDEYLLEGNTWHDNYWGVCLCNGSKCLDKVGKNKLGLILMQVRKEFKDMEE